ncbi:unnamed protein product [Adineta steineri]|uniref:Uncharacterized protein n=1 Tax=Adineta steineri TaxID=433720 RepID=A0A814UMA6_9BILA|nr:unnamed protein product [Adineta steineri]CAF1456484.1 unnamed protein product [Adineta steineri]CAF1467395.1 unnamed protein product [Adineta steineri]
MNWTHRRPFRQQFTNGGNMNKIPINRPLTTFNHLSKSISNQPIDAIRLQLADYDNPCPVHHQQSHRNHPYITTFSDQQSSVRRTHSSIHSISTVETDFVHQRVSTIHTYPSSSSIIGQQEIIHEPIMPAIEQISNESIHEQSNQCRTCLMLIEIVDQQAQQIRQHTEQISQQTDLLAKLARRFAEFEESIDEQKSDMTTEQQVTNIPINT